MLIRDMPDTYRFCVSVNSLVAHINMHHKTSKAARGIMDRIYGDDSKGSMFGGKIVLTKKEAVSVFGKDFDIPVCKRKQK